MPELSNLTTMNKRVFSLNGRVATCGLLFAVVCITVSLAFAQQTGHSPKQSTHASGAGSAPSGSCYCCINGYFAQRPMYTTACAQQGGTCYATLLQASKECGAHDPCWCCVRKQNKVKAVKTTKKGCRDMGGACFGTKAEAEACKGPPG